MTPEDIGNGVELGTERGMVPRNEADRQDAEELSLEDLDQVVGGVAPAPTWYTPTLAGTPSEPESWAGG
jgi:hypothetical protein